jgi:adenosylmethionine-8-amino-7-oxononanoate aminotransferase
VVLMPPLCVTLEELDTICRAVEQGLERATADWIDAGRPGS